MSKGITRRAALTGIGIGTGIGMGIVGCGGASADAGDDAPGDDTPNPPPETTASPAPTGTSTAPSQPPAKPAPEDLLAGIEHIVVLMMENRSFDHFLGSLASDKGYAAASKVEGLSGTETNPSSDGTSDVTVFKMSNFTPEDPPHSWAASHAQYDGGKNDGFVKAHAGESENEVMGYHDRSQIPLYYWFADNFTVCDAWHASVMGPTWPNRFYLHSTTSNGKKDNKPFFTNAPQTIWDALQEKKLSFKNYAAGLATFYVGGYLSKVFNLNPSAKIDEFFEAAKKGTLPAFSLIDPDFQASDDHPSHNILRGQAFVASVYKALAESPLWPKTLFILTYDEHGGFFDHVPPPSAVDAEPDFDRLGFRVPAFVIGPTVKKGYVCKKTLEHSSVAATLKTRWEIRSLSKRMDATSDISDCIDPVKVTAPAAPPAGMPVVAMTMDAALSDGVGTSSQPMLDELVGQGRAPAVDPRAPRDRIGSWLEHAVRLGAVRVL